MGTESTRIENHYRGESGRRYHHEKRGLPERALPWVARSRAEKLQPYIGLEDLVLEFGVGAGWNLHSLKCRKKIGFDISDQVRLQVEKSGIEFVEELAVIADGSLDVVICHHALEHVPNPLAALLTMRKLLKPAGRLLLFVPYEKEARYRRFDLNEPNHHLFSWNPQTLGNLVTDAGYRVLEAGLGRFGYDRFSGEWAVKLGIGERGFRMIRRFAHGCRPMREVRVIAESGGQD